MSPSSRRQFLGFSASAAALSKALAALSASQTPRNPIYAFSKPFRSLGFSDTADLCAEVGWDGLEVPVRAQASHVDLARADEQLPQFVEQLRLRGKVIGLLATDIVRPSPEAHTLLRLAASLGIKQYRLGFQYYTSERSIREQLNEVGAAIKDLAQLNRQLGILGGLQNHSGSSNLGAAGWDLWSLLRDIDPKDLGVCFDVGHASIEGGLSWPSQARLLRPHFAAVYVKDFRWELVGSEGGGGRTRWCPLGEGMVNRRIITDLRGTNYTGPIVQHHEYESLGEGSGRLKKFRSDLAVLKRWLS
ncbi:MAG: sugar phosphate isomerase/epimerase [Pedosphaera sp.]|nr:sugar phosphate isomerase/epimerase [Pedosphaera sp.]